MSSIILLTGCARSGTSMTAGILELCGAFGGDTFAGNPNNRKGFFENKQIRERLVKPYLKSIGADSLGQHPLPDPFANEPPKDWDEKVISIFKGQGWDGQQQLYYKGAKMSLFWPVWDSAFPEAKWIIIRRQDDQIISSCMKTGFMRAFHNREGWQGWIEEHKLRFQEMEDAGLDIVEFWPETIFRNELEPLKAMIDSIGLTWNEDAVMEFIEPKLWSGSK